MPSTRPPPRLALLLCAAAALLPRGAGAQEWPGVEPVPRGEAVLLEDPPAGPPPAAQAPGEPPPAEPPTARPAPAQAPPAKESAGARTAEPPAAEAPAAEAPAVLHQVLLHGGQALRGRLVRHDADGVMLELETGGVVTLSPEAVLSVEALPSEAEALAQARVEAGRFFPDPNRSRYFYSPSAVPLRQGERYVSQKELLFTAFAYGATDNLTLLVGGAAPLWLLPNGAGLNLLVGAKYGVQVLPLTHVAAAAELLVLPGFGFGGGSPVNVVGLASVAASYGGADAHVTLNVGRPLALAGPMTLGQANGPFIFTLSGNLRVAPHAALVTENWVLPAVSGSFSPAVTGVIHSAGVRLMSERLSVDLGAVLVGSWFGPSFQLAMPIPLPWLDFTYRFE